MSAEVDRHQRTRRLAGYSVSLVTIVVIVIVVQVVGHEAGHLATKISQGLTH